jgi:YjbE family integral membrane protein
MELFALQALWAVLAIILIDIVLAGDNALVIGMAANKLPPELRKKAIFWGTFGAVAIRFVSVALLTYLLMIPGLRLIGGLALLWIGWKLVFDQHTDESVASKTTLGGAVSTIIVADAVMGIDNALGIAAAANGDFGLVVFGLLISVPIILFGSSVVSRVLARWPDVVFAGSFVLFVVAIQMLFKEPLLAGWLSGLPSWVVASLPWTGGFTIMAVQYAKARLGLVKRYWNKK